MQFIEGIPGQVPEVYQVEAFENGDQQLGAGSLLVGAESLFQPSALQGLLRFLCKFSSSDTCHHRISAWHI